MRSSKSGGSAAPDKSHTSGSKAGGSAAPDKSHTSGSKADGSAAPDKSHTSGSKAGGSAAPDKFHTSGSKADGSAAPDKSHVSGGKGAEDDGSMSLTGHLRELRNRVAVAVVFFAAGVLLCLYFSPQIVTALMDLGTRYHYTFVYLSPQELLLVYFSVSLIGGVVLAMPVIAYEAYAFCVPGLKKSERVFFGLALLFGVICFLIGVAFAYFVTMPFMLNFLISFSEGIEVTDSISIKEYINFLMTVFIIFGIVFEMPMASVLLTRLGILRAEWLVKGRKVAIVVIFLIAALITPPDVVSQVMVAVPMIALYQVSIFLSRLVRRRKEAGEEDE